MVMFVVAGLVALFAALTLGMWIASAVGIAAVVSLWPLGLQKTLYIAGVQTWSMAQSFTLAAVPMYILMGEIVYHSGVVTKLSDGFLKLTRNVLPGGLLQSTLMSTIVFAACTGASAASAATFSSISFPELKKRGYDTGLSAATIAGGGSLGMLIPPSIPMVLYGMLAEVPVGAVYLGGVLPGLMLGLFFMVYVGVRVKRNPRLAPKEHVGLEGTALRTALSGLAQVGPFLGLIFMVVGTIYLGVATPTEAAALGVVGAMILGKIYGRLGGGQVWAAAHAAVKTTAMIYFIIFATKTLSLSIAFTGLGPMLVNYVRSMNSPLVVILMVTIIYLVLGCLIDGASIMLITIPFMVPALAAAGFNLVFVGVFLVILIEISTLTPPVGINLFVLQASTGTPISKVIRGSFPFVLMMLLALLVIYVFPGLVLWLPSMMRG